MLAARAPPGPAGSCCCPVRRHPPGLPDSGPSALRGAQRRRHPPGLSLPPAPLGSAAAGHRAGAAGHRGAGSDVTRAGLAPEQTPPPPAEPAGRLTAALAAEGGAVRRCRAEEQPVRSASRPLVVRSVDSRTGPLPGAPILRPCPGGPPIPRCPAPGPPIPRPCPGPAAARRVPPAVSSLRRDRAAG